MSTEENKTLVLRLFEAFNGQHLEEFVDEVCAPNFVLHDPNIVLPVRSRQDYKHWLSAVLAALPDQFTIEFLLAEGEKVAARYTFHRTHQGQWRGVPTAWQDADHLSLRRQLGLIERAAP